MVDEGGFVRLKNEWEAEGIAPIGHDSDIVTPVTYQARQTGRTEKVEDARNDKRFSDSIDRHIFEELNVISAIATPVVYEGSVLGLLGAHQCDRQRAWSPEDEELLETVASFVGMILESGRVFVAQDSQAHVLAAMNEDLSRLYVELAAKDAQIDKFMHLISHDLRAPVVAIRGLVDLLKKEYEDQPPDSKPRRYLELILHSAEQITQLTTALIDFARLGQSSLNLSSVDTSVLVKEIWQRFSIGAPDAELEVFGTLPVVRADHSKLVQIFQNLIENSIKYRQKDGRLIVDVTCQETEDDWQFAVNDNGMGFHPSKADGLFDLFARLKEVRNKPGSGIGLASVMEIARLHGGKAWAVGRPGKGATFYFTISKKIVERPAVAAARQ
jgi:signal transduction histidine kinase